MGYDVVGYKYGNVQAPARPGRAEWGGQTNTVTPQPQQASGGVPQDTYDQLQKSYRSLEQRHETLKANHRLVKEQLAALKAQVALNTDRRAQNAERQRQQLLSAPTQTYDNPEFRRSTPGYSENTPAQTPAASFRERAPSPRRSNENGNGNGAGGSSAVQKYELGDWKTWEEDETLTAKGTERKEKFIVPKRYVDELGLDPKRRYKEANLQSRLNDVLRDPIRFDKLKTKDKLTNLDKLVMYGRQL